MRRYLKFALKLLLAGGIIGWLRYSGKLDLTHLKLFVETPFLALGSTALFFVGFILLQSYRWRLLLAGVGIHLNQMKIMSLQMIGFFFNVAMPGAVGGDFIKAFYVSRVFGEKTKPMLTVVLDRVLGLVSMFVLATLVTLFAFDSAWSIAALRPLIIGIILVALSMPVAFLVIYLNRHRDLSALRLLQHPSRLVQIVRRLIESLWSYREKPGTILKCVVIGMSIQVFYGILIYYICILLNGQAPDVAAFATVLPFAVLLASIPLAPGGIGIGHAAFENVFMLAGIHNGANVFNVVIIGQLILSLTGAIPYILYKKTEMVGVALEEGA